MLKQCSKPLSPTGIKTFKGVRVSFGLVFTPSTLPLVSSHRAGLSSSRHIYGIIPEDPRMIKIKRYYADQMIYIELKALHRS